MRKDTISHLLPSVCHPKLKGCMLTVQSVEGPGGLHCSKQNKMMLLSCAPLPSSCKAKNKHHVRPCSLLCHCKQCLVELIHLHLEA